MSLPSDATHINPGAVAQGRNAPGQAPAIVKTPWRAKLSQLRQRTILTLRYFLRPFYRLPIDDYREQRIRRELDGLAVLGEKQLETIQTMTRIVKQLQTRLQWYETHIPRMRELKREYDVAQSVAARKANAGAEDLENGILAPKRPSPLSILS